MSNQDRGFPGLQITRFKKGEEGQTLVEYALILALLVLLAVLAFPEIGQRISGVFSLVYSRLG